MDRLDWLMTLLGTRELSSYFFFTYMYTGAVCSVCYIIHAGIYFQLNKISCMIDVKSTVLDEAYMYSLHMQVS